MATRKKIILSFIGALLLSNFIAGLYTQIFVRSEGVWRWTYVNPLHADFYLNMMVVLFFIVPVFLIFYRENRTVLVKYVIPGVLIMMMGALFTMFFSVSWASKVWTIGEVLEAGGKFLGMYLVFCWSYLFLKKSAFKLERFE